MDAKGASTADKIDEIAAQLDDVKTSVDELEDEGTAEVRAVGRLKRAVDRARDAIDELEDQNR